MRTHHRRAERLAVARLLIALARGMHTEVVNGDLPFGTDIDQVFVVACVAIGDFEGRPMSASDVSTYIDMPRTTAQRKLTELVERGAIDRTGRRYTLSKATLRKVDPYVDAAEKAIKAAQPK